MKNTELKNKAVNWLQTQSESCKTRPYRFTPKEVAEAISGAYTALGQVADSVAEELRARGVNVYYQQQGKKRFFELV